MAFGVAVSSSGALRRLVSRRRPVIRRVAHSLAVLALVAACRATGQRETTVQPATDEDDREQLAELGAEARALIGEPSCTSVAQCRAVPLGAKPCGGPWSYVVYSTESTDAAALADVVARYNALEARLNRREGRVSDCQFVSRPLLDCVDGRCIGSLMSRPPEMHSGKRIQR